jgi:hypothetical protein
VVYIFTKQIAQKCSTVQIWRMFYNIAKHYLMAKALLNKM